MCECPYCHSNNTVIFGRCMNDNLWECKDCGAMQIGAFSGDECLTSIEIETGWYQPYSQVA